MLDSFSDEDWVTNNRLYLTKLDRFGRWVSIGLGI